MSFKTGFQILRKEIEGFKVINSTNLLIQDLKFFGKIYSTNQSINLVKSYSFFENPIFFITDSSSLLNSLNSFSKISFSGLPVISIVFNKDVVLNNEDSSDDFLNMISGFGFKIFKPSNLEEFLKSLQVSKELTQLASFSIIVLIDLEIFNSLEKINFEKLDVIKKRTGFLDDFKVFNGKAGSEFKTGLKNLWNEENLKVIDYFKEKKNIFSKGFEVFGKEKDECFISFGELSNKIKELIITNKLKSQLVTFNRYFNIDKNLLKSELVNVKNFVLIHNSFFEPFFLKNFCLNNLPEAINFKSENFNEVFL